MGFFKTLFSKKKTIQYEKAFQRNHVSLASIRDVFSSYHILNQEVIEAIEDTLIMADVGLDTTENIIKKLIEKNQKKSVETFERLLDDLFEILSEVFVLHPLKFEQPTVIFVVGVNGAGKTTTIGKLAAKYKHTHKVKIIAADTFRAAAIDQLSVWAAKTNTSFFTQPSKDPSSVIYDGLKEAQKDSSTLVIIDTAGRLQTKDNLMAQLEKMRRVVDKAAPNFHVESWLVIDGTTGQNGLSQAKLFHEATSLTGLVITKLDGTTKGGIVLGIAQTLKTPMTYVGLGERIEDLVPFDIASYLNQLIESETTDDN